MKQVAVFFLVVSMLYSCWKLAPDDMKSMVKIAAKKHVVPAVAFAAALTIAMLAFAFFSNGKVI